MMKPATGPEDRFSDYALLDSPLVQNYNFFSPFSGSAFITKKSQPITFDEARSMLYISAGPSCPMCFCTIFKATGGRSQGEVFGGRDNGGRNPPSQSEQGDC